MSFDSNDSHLSQELESKSPFKLEWIFGFNSKVPLINLTSQSDSPEIALTAGHVLQIFDCNKKQLKKFIGHENEIIAIDSDATGRYIVSADKTALIAIWDRNIENEFPFPVRSIILPYSDAKLSKVTISFDGKYLLTACVGSDVVVKFWRWSSGSKEADDTFVVPQKYGEMRSIRFNCNPLETNMFVITSENGVIYGLWDDDERKLKIHFPARSISIVKNYKDTIFIENSHKAISITECGNAVVWNDMLIEVPIEDNSTIPKGSHKKELIKSIKICEYPINVIKSVDNCIVIGDDTGKIRFFDKELKILYWCPNYDLGSLTAISFDIVPLALDAREDTPDIIALDYNKFQIRNFFIGTSIGQIIYVDFHRKNFKKIWYKCEDDITAIDLHPLKKWIICGNYSGRIFVINYETKELVAENQLNIQKEKSQISDTDIISIPLVTFLAYSPCGNHLVCALENGTLLYLEPTILTLLAKLKFSYEKISTLKFSNDSKFMAYYDVNDTVTLLHFIETWNIVGKFRYHYKPICDILFIANKKSLPRLISLAADRQLVEYDLLESLKKPNRLVVAFSKRIFQASIPVSITLIYNAKKKEEEILIADNEYKLRIYDKNTFEILHSFLGPLYDDVIRHFDFIPDCRIAADFLVFATRHNICLYAATPTPTTIDSNPYRSLGIVGHCNKIRRMVSNAVKTIIFTIGENCKSVFMWKVNSSSIFDHLAKGEEGLRPYCALIPGGKYGNLFQDMQDLFFYMQLLSEKEIEEKKVLKKYFLDNLTGFIKLKIKDHMEAAEVPDFLRGLGFFLTDYEIACINNKLESERKRHVRFDDVVKIYLNYSPVNGIEKSEIREALRNVLSISNEISEEELNATKIQLSQIKSILTELGEKVDGKDADRYLYELFNGNEREMPTELTFAELCNEWLSI